MKASSEYGAPAAVTATDKVPSSISSAGRSKVTTSCLARSLASASKTSFRDSGSEVEVTFLGRDGDLVQRRVEVSSWLSPTASIRTSDVPDCREDVRQRRFRRVLAVRQQQELRLPVVAGDVERLQNTVVQGRACKVTQVADRGPQFLVVLGGFLDRVDLARRR